MNTSQKNKVNQELNYLAARETSRLRRITTLTTILTGFGIILTVIFSILGAVRHIENSFKEEIDEEVNEVREDVNLVREDIDMVVMEVDEVWDKVYAHDVALVELDHRYQKIAGCIIRITEDSIKNSQSMVRVLDAVIKGETNTSVQYAFDQVATRWGDELNDITLCSVFPDEYWYHLTANDKFLTYEEIKKLTDDWSKKVNDWVEQNRPPPAEKTKYGCSE